MRAVAFPLVVIAGLLACAACGSTSPSSPSPSAASTSATDAVPGSTPIGLSGVIRGLDLRAGTFSLAARTGTYQVRIDGRTQVWSGGTQVRAASLRDGQAVAVRGADYGQHVLAQTISINR